MADQPTAGHRPAEHKGQPVLTLASAADWEAWLAEHGATSDGLWLRHGKKGGGLTTVSYAEAVDVALCWGWIDSQKASWDEVSFLQRYTRRGRRSPWSQVNVEKVAALTAAGRMQPAGLAEVEAARADGRWDRAYAPPSRVTVPEDLQAALDGRPGAAAAFTALSSSDRYAVLYRVQEAKRPETRARRIAGFADALARGERPVR